jgi:hypothetical protein
MAIQHIVREIFVRYEGAALRPFTRRSKSGWLSRRHNRGSPWNSRDYAFLCTALPANTAYMNLYNAVMKISVVVHYG